MNTDSVNVWICWESQRRNWELADAFNCIYYKFEDRVERNKVSGYLSCLKKTFNAIKQNKPDILFVQNPSIVLSLFSVLCKPFFKYKLVVDTHNGGLYLNNKILKYLARFIHKYSITIVSNENLKKYVNGVSVILPDKLPKLGSFSNDKYDMPPIDFNKFNGLCICSFAQDEPYTNVISAFSGYPELKDFQIYISGNYKKIKNFYEKTKNLPNNIHFIGRVDWSLYESYLKHCNYVIVLTTRDDCLCCGAYEAVSAETPLILSYTPALYNYFTNVYFCDISPLGIKEAVLYMHEHYNEYKESIKKVKTSINDKWNILFKNALNFINEN